MISKQYQEAAKLSKQTELFDLQNKDARGKISIVHIGDCLRALGYYPSEEEIKEIKDQQEGQNTEYIELNEFSAMCLNQEKNKENKNFEQDLRKAVTTLFNGTDSIETNIIRALMKDQGERLDEHEVNEFIKIFDNESKINASELIDKLLQKPQW